MTGGPSASTTKGTWSVKDGTVTAEQTHADGKEEAKTVTIVHKDGTLVISEEKDGKTLSMVFAKKK